MLSWISILTFFVVFSLTWLLLNTKLRRLRTPYWIMTVIMFSFASYVPFALSISLHADDTMWPLGAFGAFLTGIVYVCWADSDQYSPWSKDERNQSSL